MQENQCELKQKGLLHRNDDIEVSYLGTCKSPKPDCSYDKHRLPGEFCQCPPGVSSPKCDRCLPTYWAYTSFGCKSKIKCFVQYVHL